MCATCASWLDMPPKRGWPTRFEPRLADMPSKRETGSPRAFGGEISAPASPTRNRLRGSPVGASRRSTPSTANQGADAHTTIDAEIDPEPIPQYTHSAPGEQPFKPKERPHETASWAPTKRDLPRLSPDRRSPRGGPAPEPAQSSGDRASAIHHSRRSRQPPLELPDCPI